MAGKGEKQNILRSCAAGVLCAVLLFVTVFAPHFAFASDDEAVFGEEPDGGGITSGAGIEVSVSLGAEDVISEESGDDLSESDDLRADGRIEQEDGGDVPPDENGQADGEVPAMIEESETPDNTEAPDDTEAPDSTDEPEEEGPAMIEEPEPLPPMLFAGSLPQLYETRQDQNSIIVEKRFVGIPEDLIPPQFRITVASSSESYVLDAGNTVGKTTGPDKITVWRWKISGAGIGKYSVSESGESIPNYSAAKEGEGSVEVTAADIEISVPVHETTCSHVNWPVKVEGDSNVLFAATLTQGGVAVISKDPLTASQRAAVSRAVLKINGPWKNPVRYYSIYEQMKTGNAFELNGATITYDPESEEILIGRTSNWQHVATLEYSVSEADDPEIVLVNTYELTLSDITPDTGVRLDGLPYVLSLVFAAAGFAVMLCRRERK